MRLTKGLRKMTWMTLAEALESAIAMGLNDAEKAPGAVTPPASETERGQKPSPPRLGRPVLSVDRGMHVAAKASAPHARAACIPMFTVIEGGRQTTGGDKPAGRRGGAVRKRARELGWVVHSAAT